MCGPALHLPHWKPRMRQRVSDRINDVTHSRPIPSVPHSARPEKKVVCSGARGYVFSRHPPLSAFAALSPPPPCCPVHTAVHVCIRKRLFYQLWSLIWATGEINPVTVWVHRSGVPEPIMHSRYRWPPPRIALKGWRREGWKRWSDTLREKGTSAKWTLWRMENGSRRACTYTQRARTHIRINHWLPFSCRAGAVILAGGGW